MALKIFNTLSRSIEEFVSINSDSVGLYTCGPTVYNYPHIGNYRAYIFGDVLKRYLKYRGYNVKHVMNITDIDDKTIRDSQAQGKTLKDFTEYYTDEFYKDRDMLNIVPADKYTKATDYIKEMIEIIESLLKNGYAYQESDGSVYFDIGKDKTYGKLAHIDLSELKDNAKGRLNKDEYEKENAQDFALWKSWDSNDGDVFWEPSKILGKNTIIPKGRPGWHIECSAMSMHELGESFDLHTGGVDNIFPHHENEIAQSECSTGKHFVKYWMHNEHLMVDGQKMAKSAGNFYTLRDLIEKGIDPIAFRLWLYTAHYRTKTNFTLDAVRASGVALKRLREFYLSLGEESGEINQTYKEMLISFMDDDLNTSKSLALMWDLISDQNICNSAKKATLADFDKIFGFGLESLQKIAIPDDVKSIMFMREKSRIEKDWQKSDELRQSIRDLGFDVKDTDEGPEILKI